MRVSWIVGIAVAGWLLAAPGTSQAADGAEVWGKLKCKTCHGDTGKADTKIAKKQGIPSMATAEWQGKFTDDAIKKGITDGVNRTEDGKKKKMKGYKDKLGDGDLDALVKLIRSWKP